MIKKFLDLGKHPLANKYIKKQNLKKKEDYYKLEIKFDTKTKLVSISNIVPAKKMFDDKYPYRSSMSYTKLNVDCTFLLDKISLLLLSLKLITFSAIS